MSATVQYISQPTRPSYSQKRVRFADTSPSEVEFCAIKFITPNSSCENLYALPAKEIKPMVANRMKCQFTLAKNTATLVDRVKQQQVCLESVLCSQFAVLGLIRVENIDFEKNVTVRYTTNNWKTHRDVWADYVSSSPDKTTDKFTFRLSPSSWLYEAKENIEFAVRYRVGGKEYWDNNDWENFCVYCYKELRVFR